MTEQTMIERMAISIGRLASEGFPDSEWYRYEEYARAVLAAMREPTESMLNYAVNKLPGCYPDDGCCMRDDAQTWRVMIDAALAE